MNLRFVEAFLWVARLKSFKGAAEKLHTTQAAISSRIATFEEELGARLFERDSRSVTLTFRGTELVPLAERMLELAQQMQSKAAARSDFAGLLRLGVMETVVHTCLPELLSRFSRLYPRVTVELHSDITPYLCDELLKGKLDCIITTEEIIDGYVENRKLAELPMAWVAAPTMSLPPEPLPFSAIARFPLVSFHRQSVIYKNILQLAGDCSEELRINCFSSLAAIISLTKTGFGVASLPLATIPQELAAGELRVVDVRPALSPLPVYASVQSGNTSPAAEEFSLLAAEVFGQFVATQKLAA